MTSEFSLGFWFTQQQLLLAKRARIQRNVLITRSPRMPGSARQWPASLQNSHSLRVAVCFWLTTQWHLLDVGGYLAHHYLKGRFHCEDLADESKCPLPFPISATPGRLSPKWPDIDGNPVHAASAAFGMALGKRG